VDTLMGYPPGIGQARHRAAGAAWLARGDWRPAPEQVAVRVGAQHGLTVALGALAGPRRVVLTEALYPGIRRAAELLHPDVRGVPVDDDGMRPDALEALTRTTRPAAVVVTPTAHNPTCATMPEPRRRAIAAALNATGVALIEGDLLSPLAGDGLALLVQLVEGRSFYIGGTSKCIAPGLRIAYLVARAEDMPHVAASIYASAVAAPPLMAEIATLWIENGTAGRHLEWHRRELRSGWASPCSRSQDWPSAPRPAAIISGCCCPRARVSELVAQAAAHGVVVTPATAFAIGGADVPSPPNAVRIGLGATQSKRDLVTALKTLACRARWRSRRLEDCVTAAARQPTHHKGQDGCTSAVKRLPPRSCPIRRA
jgi:DNA-binding transcriptional MocR family regulator